MYQRILVAIDGSPTSTRGLEEAIRLAVLTKGRLRLIHVIDEVSFSMSMDACAGHDGDRLGAMREAGKCVLEQGKAVVVASGVGVETVLNDDLLGPVHMAVTAEATSWPANLIVLGTHGRRGVGRVLVGSSAENILRYSPVPALLVRAAEPGVSTAPNAGTVHLNMPLGALATQ
ncbi:universal stress protein [Variovorax humicola]|uniref:Universal stress protein n=1 Tax=Variovorax humicola TaxID=1769758 RepID=A0ABU8VXJ4_9BURK